MARKSLAWVPKPGVYAAYTGRASRLLRGGRTVQIVAEACGQRMMVKAIGYDGSPMIFTVAAKNLGPLQPGLFE